MAGQARVTIGSRSRQPGTQLGMQLNLFALDKLRERMNGENLLAILLESAQPMLEQLVANWPVATGASRDSAELAVVEIADKKARIVLQVGGDKLRQDPRNKSGIDYAPYLEFGTNGRKAYGVLRDTVNDGELDFRAGVRDRARQLIEGTA